MWNDHSMITALVMMAPVLKWWIKTIHQHNKRKKALL